MNKERKDSSKYYCKNYILPYLKKRNIQISGKMKRNISANVFITVKMIPIYSNYSDFFQIIQL